MEFTAAASAFGVTGTADFLSGEGNEEAVTDKSAGSQYGEGAAVL